ncbi:MAG: flagellar assembly protein FliW [Nitrospiraceae bacterium]|nr:MAG: flagellar assembly protein FliW [Nitrospiraceae bacterium]
MIKINTSRFGILEADEKKIIDFSDGLIGIPDLKRFILIDHKDTPLKWLQAVDDPDIAFIVAPPDLLAAEYSIDIDKPVKKHLQIDDNDENTVILVIVRVSGDDVIANFHGPLIINAANRKGVQIVLERSQKLTVG